jgi:hypothetical protein
MLREKTLKNFVHFPHLLVGLFFLLVALTIFGSTADAKKKINACELLTLEDVEAVLAEKVQKRAGFPKIMELASGKIINSRCYYDTISSNRMVGLNITFRPNASYPKTLNEYIEVSKSEMGSSNEALKKAISVPGIGDFAVWIESWGVGTLSVYWKDYKILIMTSDDQRGIESAKALANKVIKKL